MDASSAQLGRAAPPSEIEAHLRGAWLTSDLDAASMHALAGLGRLTTVAASETVLREGDPTDSLSIVVHGRVGLRLRVPERGSVTILSVEPGDVVGWSAVVPPYRATSTAVALERSELVSFDGVLLRDLLNRDRALALAIYPRLLRAVARRLEGTRLQLLDLFNQHWVDPW